MLPDNTFDGKVALITGGGTGIGFAVADRLASLGAKVLLASRSEEHLRPAAEKIRAGTRRDDAAHYYALDVRDAAAVERTFERAVADHGGIDVLVNNAAGNFIVKAEELSPNGWNAVVGIVLNGTFYCTSSAGRRMIAAKKGGAILNVIANYAWTGSPGVVHSASAKAGVLAMTQTLAVEWARHRIRVNAIAPGPVHTEGASSKLFPDERIAEGVRRTIPLRRFASLEEVANASAYLLSDYASYVTGSTLVIDGGQWLSGADYWGRLREMGGGGAG
ncbi:MAG TPA: SDR family oxidoreductase [Thermoanaerobaculia bacterium]|nr:SDR family oxidoreductase [Thermoanaerobaculia bacterium]